MQLVEAIRILREHEADLKKIGVKKLYMFGSTARGEATSGSDVDLFYDHDPDAIGLKEFFRIKDTAAEILGCEVDIMTRDSINRHVRPYAEQEAVLVF